MTARIISILAVAAWACAAFAQLDTVTYKLPTGWKEVEREGAKIFMPGNLKEGQGFLVVMSPAEDATKESHEKQFEGVAAQFNKGDKILGKGESDKQTVAGGTIIAQAFVVEDEEMGRNMRVLATLFVGARRVSFLVVSDPPELIEKYDKELTAFWGSFKFKPVAAKPAAPKPTTSGDPNTGKAPTGDTPGYFPGMPEWRPSGRGVSLPATGIVNGRPQGLWYKSDTLSSMPSATRYVFFPDGTYLTNPRWGGGHIIDIQAQRQITPTSTGTYTIANGKLSTQTSGFKSRADAFSHGKDQYGFFFKQGAAIYRELRAPSTKTLVGKWRAMSTQYVFRADGTFEFGQVTSGNDWIAGSNWGGTYFIDGHLVVMQYTGRHTTVVPIGIVSDKQILIGTTLLVRS